MYDLRCPVSGPGRKAASGDHLAKYQLTQDFKKWRCACLPESRTTQGLTGSHLVAFPFYRSAWKSRARERTRYHKGHTLVGCRHVCSARPLKPDSFDCVASSTESSASTNATGSMQAIVLYHPPSSNPHLGTVITLCAEFVITSPITEAGHRNSTQGNI